MNIIEVKTQAEFDSLPTFFEKETEIRIIGEIKEISTTIRNAFFSVSGNGVVGSVYENGVVESVYGNGIVSYVSENGIVKSVSRNSIVKSVYGNGVVESVSGNSIVKSVSGSGVVESVYGNGTVNSVSENGAVESVYENGIVGSVYENGVVSHVFGNGIVKSVYGDGRVSYVSGNSVIHLFSPTAKVIKADQQATIIYQGYKGAPAKCADTVNILHLQKTGLTLQDFIKIYRVETSNEKLLLYKFVQTDFTDFYSGKIKYEVGTTVECPDWDDDINIECGGGLHLSSSVASCRMFDSSSNGHVLKCEVAPIDILVHPKPIFLQKVRCRKVKVLEEII